MRVLRLTNSDDTRAGIKPAETTFAFAGAAFEEATGEPIDWTIRVIWPSPALPDIIEGWLDRYEPEVVELCVNGYWYIYRSVPLHVQRKLGLLGRPIAAAGFRAGSTPWLSATRAFHFTRTALLKTIGGATYFEPREIRELMEVCARRVIQREQISLLVRGPLRPWTSDQVRDYWMYKALGQMCEQLNVQYLGVNPRGLTKAEADSLDDTDRLHTGLAGRAWIAKVEAEALVTAWQSRQ